MAKPRTFWAFAGFKNMLLLPDTKKKIIVWLIASLVIPVVVVPLHFFSPLTLSDAFLIVGIAYLGIAGLAFVHRAGTFDTFEYQFSSWMTSFKKGSPKRYKTANEYHLSQKEKRKHNSFPYLPFVLYGVLLLIVAIVLALLLVNSKQ